MHLVNPRKMKQKQYKIEKTVLIIYMEILCKHFFFWCFQTTKTYSYIIRTVYIYWTNCKHYVNVIEFWCKRPESRLMMRSFDFKSPLTQISIIYVGWTENIFAYLAYFTVLPIKWKSINFCWPMNATIQIVLTEPSNKSNKLVSINLLIRSAYIYML